MKKLLCLLLVLALLLSACGSDTATNVNDTTMSTIPNQYEEFGFMPDYEVEALLGTMTSDQLILVGKLLSLCEYYKKEADAQYDTCSTLLTDAEVSLDRLNRAEHALLTGIPLLMEVEFDHDTNSDSTVPTIIVFLGVNEDNAPYPYPNHWVGLDVNALVFNVNPGDCLNVNGETFTADENGIAKVPVANGRVPESLEIRWFCGDLSLVALIEKVDSEDQSEAKPEDNTSEPDHISEEERQTIMDTLNRELSREQYRVVEEIDLLIDHYQELAQTYEAFTDASRSILSFIEEDLAVAENTILNGIPFSLDVIFVNEDYSSTTEEICFLMAAPEGTEAPYIYPNPWVDSLVVGMVFTGSPGATLTIDGKTFIADEYGIVEVPVEDGHIDTIVDIRWTYGNRVFTTVLDNSVLNKDTSIFEAFDSLVVEPATA